jgi:hypothetical protein
MRDKFRITTKNIVFILVLGIFLLAGGALLYVQSNENKDATNNSNNVSLAQPSADYFAVGDTVTARGVEAKVTKSSCTTEELSVDVENFIEANQTAKYTIQPEGQTCLVTIEFKNNSDETRVVPLDDTTIITDQELTVTYKEFETILYNNLYSSGDNYRELASGESITLNVVYMVPADQNPTFVDFNSLMEYRQAIIKL